MADKNRKLNPRFTRTVALLVLAFPFGNGLIAAEMYAQAIGQPPEREAPPPPPPQPAKPPAPVETPPPETTVPAETPPAAEGNLRTRILIGAGVALALAALGGGGGGGAEAPPASTGAESP